MSDIFLSTDDEALYRRCLEVQVGQSAIVQFLQLHDVHHRYYNGIPFPTSISSILSPILQTVTRRSRTRETYRQSWNANRLSSGSDPSEDSGILGRTTTHLLPRVRERGMDASSILRFALLRVSLASCHKVTPPSSSTNGGSVPAFTVFQIMKIDEESEYLVRPLVGPAITCHFVMVGYMPLPWGTLYPFERHGKKVDKHAQVQADQVSNDPITRAEFKEWLSQVRRGSITGQILASSLSVTKEKLMECYAKFPGMQPPKGLVVGLPSFPAKEAKTDEKGEAVRNSASTTLHSWREGEESQTMVSGEASVGGEQGGVHLSFSIVNDGDADDENHSPSPSSSTLSNSASGSGMDAYITTTPAAAGCTHRPGSVVENERRRTTGGSGVVPPSVPSSSSKAAAPQRHSIGKTSPLLHHGKGVKGEDRTKTAASPMLSTFAKKLTKEEQHYFFDLVGGKSFQEFRRLLHESSVGMSASPNASTTHASDGLYFPRSMIDVGDVGKVRALREDLSAYLQEVTKRIPKFVECVICQSGPATVTIVPCGHTSVCPSCAGQLIHCPMCRGHIDDLIEASGR